MTDSLRDLIAAVLDSHRIQRREWHTCSCDGNSKHLEDANRHVADAVIAELGLRENFAVADEDGDFVYVGADRENSAKYTVHPGDHLMRRYVTDWKADDE